MSGERLDVINGHVWKNTGDQVRRSDDNFIYTLSDGGGLLSYEQRLFYENNGYLVIPDLVPDRLIEDCKKRFVDMCDGKIPRGHITMMKDISVVKTIPDAKGEALYYKAQDILHDEVFQQYFLNDKMLDIVECITGPNITGIHSMLINKPPDVGTLSSRHPLHQDLYYFPVRPADRIVTAWTAMEKVDESNGCLYVLPGTHKGILLQHEYPNWEGGVNKAFHGIPHKDDYPKTYLPMEKGETVFFHPLLMHGSGYNKTKGFRKAISCHFTSSDCYYIDVKDTVYELISKELEGMAMKKGWDTTHQDILKLKSKLVRGRTGTISL